MEFPNESMPHRLCPEQKPILCGKQTVSRGLCVKDSRQCGRRTLKRRSIPRLDERKTGKSYGYEVDNLGRGCYIGKDSNMIIDYEESFSSYDSLPDSFSLLTYNIWGLSRTEKLQHLFSLRKNLLLQTLRSTKADIMCLQEMSQYSYEQLKEYVSEFAFASETPYPKYSTDRQRNVDVYILAKYKPKRIAVYSLPGVLSYKNSMCVLEYPNMIIFNIYIQAGSKLSPGQSETWIHYSRCRYDILNMIHNMIHSKYKGMNVIVCGDFNCNLDGDLDSWPELRVLEQYNGFIDTYRHLHSDSGFTEDTDLNLMRYNQKLVVKKYRYDAILYRPVGRQWIPTKSHIIGKRIQYLPLDESKWFFEEISDGKSIEDLKGVRFTKRGYNIPINASDHFGVLTTFDKN